MLVGNRRRPQRSHRTISHTSAPTTTSAPATAAPASAPTASGRLTTVIAFTARRHGRCRVTELIEGELIAAIGQSGDELPLRDAYLLTIDATFELGQRACVGGVVSLLAIARRRGDVRDYVLFTQERSSTVLNLAGKLATIPKGFHQPTGEPTHEVRPSATVRREFEEELLGRRELEQIEPLPHSHVDLLHDQNLTEPMVWLLDRPDSFRLECTGFGFNLVTGNYEFAGLVVIDDEDWWERFGHLVESSCAIEAFDSRKNGRGPVDPGVFKAARKSAIAAVGDPVARKFIRRWLMNRADYSLEDRLRRVQKATGNPTWSVSATDMAKLRNDIAHGNAHPNGDRLRNAYDQAIQAARRSALIEMGL